MIHAPVGLAVHLSTCGVYVSKQKVADLALPWTTQRSLAMIWSSREEWMNLE